MILNLIIKEIYICLLYMSNIKALIDTETYNNIQALYQQTKPGQEFELIINNINNKYFGQEKYIQLLKYFKLTSEMYFKFAMVLILFILFIQNIQ